MGRKLGWSAFALAVCVLAVSGLADTLGKRYANDALERAVLTFAAARTLDGVISLAQGTEVAIEPGGVGVNLSVGQVLDPVNDLIERFSGIMLTAMAALGVQEILLRITGSQGVSLLLGGAALLVLLALWVPAIARRTRWQAFALRFLVLSVVLRFAVPLLVIATNVVFERFLATEQAAATAALEVASTEIQVLSQSAEANPDEERSWFERMRERIGDSIDALNVEARMNALQQRASGVTRHVVNLIVIFLLQTIALPLAFLWLVAEGVKAVLGRATHIAASE